MKSKHILLLAFLLSAFAADAQKTLFVDYIKGLKEIWWNNLRVVGVEPDSTFPGASHLKIPTVKAVKDYVDANGGGGGGDDWGSQVVEIGDGLGGNGTGGDPLYWAGTNVAGPLTGSGLPLSPLNLLNNSITDAHIANDAVDSTEIQAGAVRSSDIGDGQVWKADLAANSVDSTKIEPNAVQSSDIANGAVWKVDLAANSVDSTKISNKGISVFDIGQNGATSGQVLKWNGNMWLPSADAGTSSLTNAHIFVGNSSNVATDVAMSGDATISNAGVVTVASANQYFAITQANSKTIDNPENNASFNSSRMTMNPSVDMAELTGINTGTNTGKLIFAYNASATNRIVLVNESASSTDVNRFNIPGNKIVKPKHGIVLAHIGSRWQVVGEATVPQYIDTLTYVGSTLSISLSDDNVPAKTVTIAAGGGSADWGDIGGTLSDQTDLQSALDGKVDENSPITGATKTKVTYDSKGLVTAGADATTSDIGEGSNLYYTDERVDDRVNALVVPGAGISKNYDDGANTYTITNTGDTDASDDATLTGSQTLTNKTLTSPVINTPTITVNDNVFTVQDQTDNTKKFLFEASTIGTGTTRTVTVQNKNYTMAATDDAAGGDMSGTLSNLQLGAGVVGPTELAAGAVDLASGDVTGTLPVTKGGSGATALTGYVKGNNTAAFTAAASIPEADISDDALLARVASTETVSGNWTFTGTGNRFRDNAFTISDNGDNTKLAILEASGITTGTTRTYSLPNASGTLALLSDLSGNGGIYGTNGNIGGGTTDVTATVGSTRNFKIAFSNGNPALEVDDAIPSTYLRGRDLRSGIELQNGAVGIYNYIAGFGSSSNLNIADDGVELVYRLTNSWRVNANGFFAESTTKMLHPPPLTTTERDAISSPIEGGVYYNETTKKLGFRTNTSFVELDASGGGGGPIPFNDLLDADGTNTIDNEDFAQTWAWSIADTENPLSMTANGLTSGSILNLSTTNNSLNSTNGLLNVDNNSTSTNGLLAQFRANNTATGKGVTMLTNGRVGIGTASPGALLNVAAQNGVATPAANTVAQFSNADASPTVVLADAHSTATAGASFLGRHARGTVASPSATLNSDDLVSLSAAGYHSGNAYTNPVGYASFRAAQNFTNSAQGTEYIIGTTQNGGTSPADRLKVGNDGIIRAFSYVAGAIVSDNSGIWTSSKVLITTPATGATLTLANNSTLATSGANSVTLTSTGATNLTLPTGGTLATLAGTETLTNKAITKRAGTTASSSTPTPTASSQDVFTVTALAVNATFGSPGTGTEGQSLLIRIKDNGTSRTLAWNAIYRFSAEIPAPSATTANATMYVTFVYNNTDSKWDCVGSVNGF